MTTSLLCWTRVQNHWRSASSKQRELSHRSELVYMPTSCRWKCRSTSFITSQGFEMPEVQSLVSDPKVYSIDGPMCRWSLKARGSSDKVEFMRKQIRWLTRSKEIAEVLRGDGRWKRGRRHIHMMGKSETVSEYLASLVVAMLSAIKRQCWRTALCRTGARRR